MDIINESFAKLLNIDKKDELGNEIINQISSIDVEKIQSLIQQILNLRESPLVFIRMNSEFNEGEDISGRIICLDTDFYPLKSQVIFTTDSEVVFEGYTDDLGSLEFKFAADKKSYEVRVLTNGKEKTLTIDLTKKEEDYVCYVVTDRDYYMPGQKMLIRFLVWKMIGSSYRPSGEVIKVSLIDPQKNRILLREISCDPIFGVGELQIPIAEEAIQGIYTLEVSTKGSKSEKLLHIEHYKPPDIALNVECEPQYLKMGNNFKLKLKSKFFYGSPVKGGQVKLEILSPDKTSVLQTYGETDENGEYEYKFKVPKIRQGECEIKIILTDALKREAKKDLKISSVKKVLIVKTDMAPSIEPGQQAELIIKTEIPTLEGKTVPIDDCMVLASINDTELKYHTKFITGRTDIEGRCPITFEIDYPTEKKKNFDINIIVESEKLKESETIRRGLAVQKAEPKEKEKELSKVWLNTQIGQTSLNIDEFLILNINAERSDIPVYVDLEKENIIYRTAKNLVEGSAEIQIPITRDMWGNIKIIAYAFRENGILEKNERNFYVNPKGKELKVSIESDKNQYNPGDKATFKVRVLQGDQIIACCLGAMLVDAAVLELGRDIKTPLDIFFKKEFTKKTHIELQSWALNEYSSYFNALMEALIHYVYLNSKLIGGVVDFSKILNKAGLFTANDLNTVQEKLVNQIRETAKKNKEKNKKTLTFNVLQIISESLISLKDIEIVFKAIESEIIQISDKEFELYQKIITDINSAENKGYITNDQKELILIKVHGKVLEASTTKTSPLTLKLRKELEKLLNTAVKEKSSIEQLMEKLDLKFKPLKKATSEDLKEPEGKSLCLELGSDTSAVGFAGEDSPRSIIPTLIGYPKYTSIMSDVEHYTREYYIGEEAMDLGAGGIFLSKTTSSSGTIDGPEIVHRSCDHFLKSSSAMDKAIIEPLMPLTMVSVRFLFPETSLWIPFRDSEGESIIETELPDQISSHELIVCASTKNCEAGMGTQRITVKQDFFIQLDIPPVLTHGDNVELGVILTNLTNEDLNCKLNLNPDKYMIDIETGQDEILVPANEMSRLDFKLKALNPGEATLWIEGTTPKYVDVVKKNIKIKPKGEPHILRYTGLILENDTISISPTMPEEAIYYKAHLSLVPGYQMGCIDGLESIMDYPHGCTEQTMSRFLPNVLVYNFLKEREKVTTQFQEKINDMVVVGLQQLLSLRHVDRGWGWWQNDKSDPFLTAYVLFGLAYTINSGFFVDNQILNDAIKMLISSQDSQGAWTSTNRNQEFCTTYIIQALLEARKAGFSVNEPILDKALNYILSKVKATSEIAKDPDLIAHIIMVMIESGFDTNRNEFQFLMERLNLLSKSKEDYIYWEKGSAMAGNVESTAYAAMALHLSGGDPVTVQKALKYIMSHRAKDGGWSTTSDTVAAIRCLSKCIRSEKSNYKVKATFNKQPLGEFIVKNETIESVIYDMRNIPLKDLESDNKLTLEKKGEGLLVYDLVLEAWYPKEYLLKPQKLTIAREFSSNKIVQNDSITVKIIITTTEKQGLFVIEEPIPAGFLIFEPSLKKLMDENKIANYKLTHDKLNIYLEKLEGSITLTYQMIATKAGEIMAKETIAYPMYNVQLKANSTIKKLEIT